MIGVIIPFGSAEAPAQICSGRQPTRQSVAARGFTLIELCVVIVLIAIIMAVAMPRLLPVISYSKLEGAALHLGHYGRAVIQQATLDRQLLTVEINLDKQQYKTVRRVEVAPSDASSSAPNNSGLFSDTQSAFGPTSSSQSPSLADGGTASQGEEMQAAFDQFQRLALQSRARNVQQDDMLSDIGPLFDRQFTLDPNAQNNQYEDVTTPLLTPTALPDNVRIEDVRFGGKDHTKGIVKIDVSPLGLTEPVEFYVLGDNGDSYTVLWDAITGEATVAEGKQNLL